MTDLLAQLAQPGDRWEIAGSPPIDNNTLLLDPSWDILLDAAEPARLEASSSDKPTISVRYDPERHALIGPGLGGMMLRGSRADIATSATTYLELVTTSPLQFRLIAEADTPVTLPAEVTTDRGVALAFTPDELSWLDRAPATFQSFELSRRAARFATSVGFDNLISLPLLHDVELLPHQLKTALTVLRRFRGRALLCDEVGLGKTIEAGLILLELLMRKLARRVLILTPSSLVEQ